MQDLETKVVDLEFSNQKLIQKIHDLEQEHKEEIGEVRASHGDALKIKDRSLKEMRAQRDCLHQELQEMKGMAQQQRMRSPKQESFRSPKQDSIMNQSINMSLHQKLQMQQDNLRPLTMKSQNFQRPQLLGSMTQNPFSTKKGGLTSHTKNDIQSLLESNRGGGMDKLDELEQMAMDVLEEI